MTFACETCRDTHEVEEPYEEKVAAPGSPSGHVGYALTEMVDCPDCCVACDHCGRLAHDLEPGYRQLTDHFGAVHWCDADCLKSWLDSQPDFTPIDSLTVALDVCREFALRISEGCDEPARADTDEGLTGLVRKLME